jgi:hypothetical protein
MWVFDKSGPLTGGLNFAMSCSGDRGRPCSNVAMTRDTTAPSNSKRLAITVSGTLAEAANCVAASEIPTKHMLVKIS